MRRDDFWVVVCICLLLPCSTVSSVPPLRSLSLAHFPVPEVVHTCAHSILGTRGRTHFHVLHALRSTTLSLLPTPLLRAGKPGKLVGAARVQAAGTAAAGAKPGAAAGGKSGAGMGAAAGAGGPAGAKAAVGGAATGMKGVAGKPMNGVTARAAAPAAMAGSGRGDASGGGGGGGGGGGSSVSRDGKVSAGGRRFDVRGGGSQLDWQGVRTKGKEGVRGPKALGVAAGGERFEFGFENGV